MRAFAVLLALSVAGLGVYWLWGAPYRPTSPAWRAVAGDLDTFYPDVPSTSTAALAERLDSAPAPVVLDARTRAEYAVSHLPGARWLDPDAGDLAAALDDLDRQRPVVVYCSVGIRSAGVVRRLREAGFGRVENLEGSIFRWANEGRPLVRDGAPASEVHPYNTVWGRLLHPARRADLD